MITWTASRGFDNYFAEQHALKEAIRMRYYGMIKLATPDDDDNIEDREERGDG